MVVIKTPKQIKTPSNLKIFMTCGTEDWLLDKSRDFSRFFFEKGGPGKQFF